MKICILTHTFPRFPGDSAAPFMEGLANGLANKENEVIVLTAFSPQFKNISRKYRLITYKYIWPKRLHILGYSKTMTNDMGLKLSSYLLSPFLYLFGFLALYKLVKKEKIDLINAHWILPNGFIAGLVSLLTGTPVVSTLPGSDVYMARKNFLFRLMATFAATKSKRITSNSPQLLNDLKKITGGFGSNKTLAILYGVDSEIFKPDNKSRESVRKSLKIKRTDFVVLGVGRLVAKKGFAYLIKAAQIVLRKVSNATFVIIGEGNEETRLQDLAKRLGIYNKFVFVGQRNYKDLPDFYNSCDAFALPSIRDEKGNLDDQSVSVVEAMSVGKPVITTDFPGYRILIENNKNGFLTMEKDFRSIAGYLLKLASSKSQRTQMGKEARKSVLKKFSWGPIAKQYSTLFSQILKS